MYPDFLFANILLLLTIYGITKDFNLVDDSMRSTTIPSSKFALGGVVDEESFKEAYR